MLTRYKGSWRVALLAALLVGFVHIPGELRAALDVVFVLDCSGSMRAQTVGSGSSSRMELAVRAIELFAIGLTPDDTVGVSGFSWNLAGLQIAPQPVTDEFFDQVKKRIFAERADGYTDILLGIRAGRDMLRELPSDPGRRKILILLTDGCMKSASSAAMVDRYGSGTVGATGEQWRPLIARDTEWFVQSEIPVYTIVLGSEEDARREHIDITFGAIVSAMTHGAMHWARSADDLRSIYQNLWHQLTARPIPRQRVVGGSIEVEVGERIAEMQIVLSASRRAGLIGRVRGHQMDVEFFHNNQPVTATGHLVGSVKARRGEYALAHTITNPEPGVWRIEPKGLQADIWVDVDTWWTVEARLLGSDRDEIDIREPFLFEVAVLDKETRRPIEDPSQIQMMAVLGMVSPVQAKIALHDNGQVPLRWDVDRKAFVGSFFSGDGRSANLPGEFNVIAKVNFFEIQDTTANTIFVRDIPPSGRLTTLPDRIHAFASQGRRSDLAGVSAVGSLVRPTLYLDASRDISAEAVLEPADLVHADTGHRIPASRIQGERSFKLSARETAEIALSLDVPADTPAGRYQGIFTVRSRTPRVTGTELPVTLDVGGAPPSVNLHAMVEPGVTLELNAPLDIPAALFPHVQIGMEPLVGLQDTRFDIVSTRVAEQQVKVQVTVPVDAPGGMYSATLPIRAPGLAEGMAKISIDVVRHKVVPERIGITLVPGKQTEVELTVESTASELLDYVVNIPKERVPEGLQLSVEPDRAGAFYELPARFRVKATADERLQPGTEAIVRVTTRLGPVAEVPIKVNVVRLEVKRISRHDTFRVPAGGMSAPIEYRLSTSSQQPLRLDVIAEEWFSADGRALTVENVEFESAGIKREGRTEIVVSSDQPASLSVRAKAPAHARGSYEGSFVVTSAGLSEVREPLKLQVGAIWIEGENPLVLSDDTQRWEGKITVHSSMETPVPVVMRVQGDSELVHALTIRPSAEATSPEAPLTLDLTVDRESLSYGRHSARVELDTQGVAGKAIWTINLFKRPVEVLSRISVRTPEGRRLAREPIVFQDRSEGSVTEWRWDFGDGNTSTEQHPLHTYAEPGNYDVSLQVSGPYGESSDAFQVAVKEGFILDFTVRPRRGQLPLGDRPFRVRTRNRSRGGELVYSWDFGDGSPVRHEFEPEHMYQDTGDYIITLTATDQATGQTQRAPDVRIQVLPNQQVQDSFIAMALIGVALVVFWLAIWLLRPPSVRSGYSLGTGKLSKSVISVGADCRALTARHDIPLPRATNFFPNFAILQQAPHAPDIKIEETTSGSIRLNADTACLRKSAPGPFWGGGKAAAELESMILDEGSFVEINGAPYRVSRNSAGMPDLIPGWQLLADERGIDELKMSRGTEELVAEAIQEPISVLPGDIVGFGDWLYSVALDKNGVFNLNRSFKPSNPKIKAMMAGSALLLIIPLIYLAYCYFLY